MDFQKLGSHLGKTDTAQRKIVTGRTLQFDADFACYEAADLEGSVKQSFSDLLKNIDAKRRFAGAEFVNAHVTIGRKSGRDELATVKEYQENRDPDAPIKVLVRELRSMLADYTGEMCTPVVGRFREADDNMARMQTESIRDKGIDSSVIMSGDKDLWMVQGWHCNSKTSELRKADGYGTIGYEDVGNVKPKLMAKGTVWFWHQLIMGDKADNIPGLEKICNSTLDRITPLKSKKRRKAGSAACGEAKAVALLEGLKSDAEAAQAVLGAYTAYYDAAAHERMFEQAYLLWMQRSESVFDVVDFFEEIGCPVRPTPAQTEILLNFEREMEKHSPCGL